jgi:16S rRNA (cytosine967-C5)-methyltransferase
VLDGRSLSEVLETRLSVFDPRDRALGAELAQGVCRWQPRLAFFTDRLLEKGLRDRDRDVLALLWVGLYQLEHTRVPAHAAVAASVEAARGLGKQWAAGMVNAVLRNYQRQRDALGAAAEQDDVARYAEPAWLIERIRAAWPEDWQDVLEALLRRPPMTLRVNSIQGDRRAYAAELTERGLRGRPVDGVDQALQLDKPLSVEALPGFAEGRVSVQDAGAQLAAQLLDVHPEQRVLDACAAPGGKTCHILERIPTARVQAIDISETRLTRVRANLERLHLQADVDCADVVQPAGDWAERRYQRILLDVPCSATGVMRRHPDIKLLRRSRDVTELALRQAAILDAVWPLLEPGGKLLYVTCSILPAENDQQIDAFLQRQSDARALNIDAQWGVPRGQGRQVRPGEHDMDGFFYAVLEKSGS